MADIQRVQVLPVERGGVDLAFDAMSFAEFASHSGETFEVCLRVYAREPALTFPFIDAIQRVLSQITCPESKPRTILQRHAVMTPSTASHWFVYHTAKSLVAPIDSHDASQMALATLRAASDLQHEGDVVIELVNATTLIDRLWCDLVASRGLAKSPRPAIENLGCMSAARRTPSEAARYRREQFLERDWPTSAVVGARLGANNAAQCAADLRAAGRLLGGWSAKEQTYVHPDCQFAENHEPLAVMRELLQILPSDGDEGGWRRVFWLYGTRDALDGHSPAEMLRANPGRVLNLARQEFVKTRLKVSMNL